MQVINVSFVMRERVSEPLLYSFDYRTGKMSKWADGPEPKRVSKPRAKRQKKGATNV